MPKVGKGRLEFKRQHSLARFVAAASRLGLHCEAGLVWEEDEDGVIGRAFHIEDLFDAVKPYYVKGGHYAAVPESLKPIESRFKVALTIQEYRDRRAAGEDLSAKWISGPKGESYDPEYDVDLSAMNQASAQSEDSGSFDTAYSVHRSVPVMPSDAVISRYEWADE